MLQTQEGVDSIIRFERHRIAAAFEYIEQKWPELTVDQKVDDGTLVGLPYPYVVPSVTNPDADTHFSFKELYYWDSYFIIQGLLVGGHHDLAAGILEDLLFLFKKLHLIPNGSRYYHSSRSQAPLLTSFIFDIYDKQEKDLHWLNERLEIAEREYRQVWTNTQHPNWRSVFEGLSRYYDINVLDDLAECESGWDMTTRFYGRALSYIPIDLNCLLYKYEMDFARGAKLNGDEGRAALWQEIARKRANKVTDYLWDEEKGFFFDYNYNTQERSDVWSLAGYYALWSGLASDEQAKRLVDNLDKFQLHGGLSTTAKPTTGQHFPFDMPHQWAYPNGWAPLHWLTANGLKSYGYNTQAEEVVRTWLKTNLDYYERHGVFREAYNVVDPLSKPQEGVYPAQLGFGWTNAVFIDLAKKFLNDEELALV